MGDVLLVHCEDYHAGLRYFYQFIARFVLDEGRKGCTTMRQALTTITSVVSSIHSSTLFRSCSSVAVVVMPAIMCLNEKVHGLYS